LALLTPPCQEPVRPPDSRLSVGLLHIAVIASAGRDRQITTGEVHDARISNRDRRAGFGNAGGRCRGQDRQGLAPLLGEAGPKGGGGGPSPPPPAPGGGPKPRRRPAAPGGITFAAPTHRR